MKDDYEALIGGHNPVMEGGGGAITHGVGDGIGLEGSGEGISTEET